MTRRLFVCHATADIEATSELVDALEHALSFSAGSVWTSSLPGYSADPNDMPALGAALAGSDVVLALVTETSVHDAQFHFQLGAAWGLGAHTILFLLDASTHDALPGTLSQASVMRGHEPSQWHELIGDLSVRLGLVPRPGASSAPAITASSAPPAPKSAAPRPSAAPSAESAATPAAATSASNAQGPAPSAAVSASNAQGPAPAAATSASNAQGPAPAAATSASNAQGLAPAAATSASNAQGPAPSAATGVLIAQDPATLSQTANAQDAARAAATSIAHESTPALANTQPSAAVNAQNPAPSAAASVAHESTPALANTPPSAAANAQNPDPSAAASVAHESTPALANTPPSAATPRTSIAPTSARKPGSTPAASEAATPAIRAPRADDTPLPAAVAKIANASARPPGAALPSSAKPPPLAAQPRAAAPSSVPPLPGARSSGPASVPPLSAAAVPRAVGVPPLPAAAATSAVMIPPPPAAEADDSDAQDVSEPPTTPSILIASVPQLELDPDAEPEAADGATALAKPDLKPQPRAAGTYPSVAPTYSYLDELRAIGGPDPEERTPPRYSYVDELETLDPEDLAAAASGYEALPSDEADDDEPETREQLRVAPRQDATSPAVQAPAPVEQVSDSDVFARLPTCEMALEAGRAVSDCMFNRDEIDDFAPELDEPLGGLIESLGASWVELRSEQDLDTWVAVTDHLLQTLPDEFRKLEEWYRVGYELATLHNLAGQLVLDGSDASAEQHWRGALERFLMRAERAEIGYENLGRVLGLLENLVGPSHERDLSNIPRSLEELRRYAAGADIHTAA